MDYFLFSFKGAACKGQWFEPFSTSWTRYFGFFSLKAPLMVFMHFFACKGQLCCFLKTPTFFFSSEGASRTFQKKTTVLLLLLLLLGPSKSSSTRTRLAATLRGRLRALLFNGVISAASTCLLKTAITLSLKRVPSAPSTVLLTTLKSLVLGFT